MDHTHKIAISYRRDDSQAAVGRIYDHLETAFGKEDVFIDFDHIPFGVDFRDHIQKVLAHCYAVLVVIGPRWAGGQGDATRRLDDPTDLLRIEVETALASGILVIPILLDGTRMPSPSELPEKLHNLPFRHALELDSGANFKPQIEKLIKYLGREKATLEERKQQTEASRTAEAEAACAKIEAEADLARLAEERKRQEEARCAAEVEAARVKAEIEANLNRLAEQRKQQEEARRAAEAEAACIKAEAEKARVEAEARTARLAAEKKHAENCHRAAEEEAARVNVNWDDAVRYTIEQGWAKTSLLQRKFHLDYACANRLLDLIAKCGVIGPASAAGKRMVLPPGNVDHVAMAQAAHTQAEAAKVENLVRWIAARQPREWVKEHSGLWDHGDWSALLESLRQSEFWPLDERAIRHTLDSEKDRYLQKAEKAKAEAKARADRSAAEKKKEEEARRIAAARAETARADRLARERGAAEAEAARVAAEARGARLAAEKKLEETRRATEAARVKAEQEELAKLKPTVRLMAYIDGRQVSGAKVQYGESTWETPIVLTLTGGFNYAFKISYKDTVGHEYSGEVHLASTWTGERIERVTLSPACKETVRITLPVAKPMVPKFPS